MKLTQYRPLESPLLWWLVFGGSLGVHLLVLFSTIPALVWQSESSSQKSVTPIEVVELEDDSPVPSEAVAMSSSPTPASSPSSPETPTNPDFSPSVGVDEGAIALPPAPEEAVNENPIPAAPADSNPSVPEASPESREQPDPLTPESPTPPVTNSPSPSLPSLEESPNLTEDTSPESTLPMVTVPQDPTITSIEGNGLDLPQPDAALAVTIFEAEPDSLAVPEGELPLDNFPAPPPELLQGLDVDTSAHTTCESEISEVLQPENQFELGKYVPLQLQVEPDGQISQVTYREDYFEASSPVTAPPNEAYITLAQCLVNQLVNQSPPFEPARLAGEPISSSALILFVSINPD